MLHRYSAAATRPVFGRILRFFVFGADVLAHVEIYAQVEDDPASGLPVVDIMQVDNCVQVINTRDLKTRIAFAPLVDTGAVTDPRRKKLEQEAGRKDRALAKAKTGPTRHVLAQQVADLRRQLNHMEVDASSKMCVLGATVDLNTFLSLEQVNLHFPDLFN